MNLQSQPMRLRFTVDEYYKMIELGMLKDYEQAEIIEGELIKNMPIEDRHGATVDWLNRILGQRIPDTILLRVQNPIRLSDYSEPQPDLSLADLTKFDGKRKPKGNEVLIAIEVSDTTLKYDRDVKLSLYAEAEIPEVWIINLPNNIIEVHQNPSNGIYQLAKIFKHGESIKSEVLPDLNLEVDEILF